jgi:hypothetical protein
VARVHHVVPTWEPGAIGAHVVNARRVLHDAGVDGNVYAGIVRDGLPVEARPIDALARDAGVGDVVVYEHAIGSAVADTLVARDGPLVVQYHNITPHEFLDAWDRGLADALDWGRRQLRPLARRSVLGLGDSAYNEGELRDAGFTRTAIAPVLVDVARRGAAVDGALVDELRATKRGTDWLFVGRLAPNKAQHELVKAFAHYRRVFDAARGCG